MLEDGAGEGKTDYRGALGHWSELEFIHYLDKQ